MLFIADVCALNNQCILAFKNPLSILVRMKRDCLRMPVFLRGVFSFFCGVFFLLQSLSADAQESMESLMVAAKKGSASAQYELGFRYLHGVGTPVNEKEALNFLQKAAKQGDANAQHLLGFCQAAGLGGKPNLPQAVAWYRKAAAQNLAEAQYKLGFCCEMGLGMPRNNVEAAGWYRKAAEQDVIEAQYALGLCYEEGRGVEKNYAEKLKWFLSAAERGYPMAQGKVARSYYLGQGVEQRDYVEALKWAILADAQGNDEIADLLEILRKNADKRMTAADLAEGEKRAKQFRAISKAR